MKKAYIAALLVVGFGISALAADNVPLNQLGGFTFPNYAGSKTCVLGISTGTNDLLCATGSGVIMQVIPSTTTTDILVFRDSATANHTSTILASVGGAAVAGTYIYPQFKNGLSVTASATNGTLTVIYAQPK